MDFLALSVTIFLLGSLLENIFNFRAVLIMFTATVALWSLVGISHYCEPTVITETIISSEYEKITFTKPVKIIKTHTSYPFTFFRDSYETIVSVDWREEK